MLYFYKKAYKKLLISLVLLLIVEIAMTFLFLSGDMDKSSLSIKQKT